MQDYAMDCPFCGTTYDMRNGRCYHCRALLHDYPSNRVDHYIDGKHITQEERSRMQVDTETGEILEAKQLVKVQFVYEGGYVKPREYTYWSDDKLKVGDIILVPVRDGDTAKAQVSAIDVPEKEIEKFRDRVKTIPEGSKVEMVGQKSFDLQETLHEMDKYNEQVKAMEQELEDRADTRDRQLDEEEESRQAEVEAYFEGEMPNLGKALIKVPPVTQDKDIELLSNEALKIRTYAQDMVVADLDGDKQATNDLTMIAGVRKEIETKQKEWLAPLKQHEKEIKDAFALMLDPLNYADKMLRSKILSFRQEQDRIRKAQEEAARKQEEANRAAIEAAKLANEPVVKIEPIPEIIAPEPVKTVRADVGMSSVTKVKKWRFKEGLSLNEILTALPLEWHMVNETKIGQAVRAKGSQVTTADFGGVIEIYEEDSLKVRGR